MTAGARQRATLDANKREMFDGMRAYHESELAHKRDAITLLMAILTAVGAVFAALVLGAKPVPNAGVLAAFAALAATLGAFCIAASTNRKIDADHQRYAEFGAEYVRTCELLGLYIIDASDPENTPLKANKRIGQGLGHEKTKSVVRMVALTTAILSWLVMLFIWLAICPGSHECSTPWPDRAARGAPSAPVPGP